MKKSEAANNRLTVLIFRRMICKIGYSGLVPMFPNKRRRIGQASPKRFLMPAMNIVVSSRGRLEEERYKNER